MAKEYRLVSTDKRGYFYLYGSRKESACARFFTANAIGSQDVMGACKVQERNEGIEGDDSTWSDSVCEPLPV